MGSCVTKSSKVQEVNSLARAKLNENNSYNDNKEMTHSFNNSFPHRKLEIDYSVIPIKHDNQFENSPSPFVFGLVGLVNIGNTCFMNSALQCLINISTLTDYFLNNLHTQEINSQNELGSKGAVANAFAELLKEIWSQNTITCIRPDRFYRAIGHFAPQFSYGTQEDSHEFLAYLLDIIHEDLNRVKIKPKYEEFEPTGKIIEEQAANAWKYYLMRNKSIIVDLFQGQLKSSLKCQECKHISNKFEPFMYLSVPVPEDQNINNITLIDCLKEYSKEEKLDKDEMWYCPKCKQFRESTKKIDILKLPNILIIHFKRFKFTRHKRGKIRSFVDFPISDLDLTNIVGSRQRDRPLYDLFAISVIIIVIIMNYMGKIIPQLLFMNQRTFLFCFAYYLASTVLYSSWSQMGTFNRKVKNERAANTILIFIILLILMAIFVYIQNHEGTLGHGHYTCYAKNRDDNNWYSFNDSMVQRIEQLSKIISSSAYLLFYAKTSVEYFKRQTISHPEAWPHILRNSTQKNEIREEEEGLVNVESPFATLKTLPDNRQKQLQGSQAHVQINNINAQNINVKNININNISIANDQHHEDYTLQRKNTNTKKMKNSIVIVPKESFLPNLSNIRTKRLTNNLNNAFNNANSNTNTNDLFNDSIYHIHDIKTEEKLISQRILTKLKLEKTEVSMNLSQDYLEPINTITPIIINKKDLLMKRKQSMTISTNNNTNTNNNTLSPNAHQQSNRKKTKDFIDNTKQAASNTTNNNSNNLLSPVKLHHLQTIHSNRILPSLPHIDASKRFY